MLLFLAISIYLLSTYFILTFFSVISVIVLCCNYSCFMFPSPWFLSRSSLFPVSLPMSSKSFISFIGPYLFVFSVFILWLLLPVFVLSCVLFRFGLPVVFILILTIWFWPSVRVLADNSLALCLCTSIYVITWILTSACCSITISALPH